MFIQALQLIAVTAMFLFLAAILYAGTRPEPPKVERIEISEEEQATLRLGLEFAKLVTDQGPDGRCFRAASEHCSPEDLAEMVAALPPVILCSLTPEQLRRHIVRCCRFILTDSPYRAAVH